MIFMLTKCKTESINLTDTTLISFDFSFSKTMHSGLKYIIIQNRTDVRERLTPAA